MHHNKTSQPNSKFRDSRSCDHLAPEMIDDIFADLCKANVCRNNNDNKVTYIERSTIFPAHHVATLIHNFCQCYHFSQTIECFANELFERIFDEFLRKYCSTLCDSLIHTQQYQLVQFNLNNPTFLLFNSTLCSSLLSQFFFNIKDERLTKNISHCFKSTTVNNQNFLAKSLNLLCFVSVFLAQKLHGNRWCNNDLHDCVKKGQRDPVFNLEFYLIKHHYPAIESGILQLLKFDLHIDTLNQYVDCLLSMIRRKLWPALADQLTRATYPSRLRELIFQLNHGRVQLVKLVVSQLNDNRPFGTSQPSDHNSMENLCNDKLLQGSALILASCLIAEQSPHHNPNHHRNNRNHHYNNNKYHNKHQLSNLPQYVLDLLVSITRLSSRNIAIFANNLCNIHCRPLL